MRLTVEMLIGDFTVSRWTHFSQPGTRLELATRRLCHLIERDDAARLIGVGDVANAGGEVGAERLQPCLEVRMIEPVGIRARGDCALLCNFFARPASLEGEL